MTPDEVTDQVPPHVHAMMAEDQKELMLLRTELEAVIRERDEWHAAEGRARLAERAEIVFYLRRMAADSLADRIEQRDA
jgi:hypothetical protein